MQPDQKKNRDRDRARLRPPVRSDHADLAVSVAFTASGRTGLRQRKSAPITGVTTASAMSR
jgi:hypothetical protein